MGFLLFAGRKLQLKSRINQLNFRNMQLSQEQQTIQSQIASKQQMINAAKNQLNTCAQGYMMNSIMSSLSANSDVASILSSTGKDIQSLLNGGMADLTADQQKTISTAYSMAQYEAQMKSSYATNVMNSVLDASSQADLQVLQGKDQQISMELESNGSQLELLQAEYQAVKKQEGSEAQNSAASFGLA